jgi:membrane protein YqaA with SNARE-associated domain
MNGHAGEASPPGMTQDHPTVTAPPAAPAVPEAKAVPRWAWHRRLYDWMLSFAHSRYATLALFLFSFTEAIFFPIPPIVLQVPLSLERRRLCWRYAFVCTIASVLGGVAGYGIGWAFHDLATAVFGRTALETVREWSANVWLLSAGVIAVHPFKLFTIAAGFVEIPMISFLIASLVGRAALFYSVAAMLWFFGPPVRVLIERYFNLLTIAFGVLIIGLIVLIKVL